MGKPHPDAIAQAEYLQRLVSQFILGGIWTAGDRQDVALLVRQLTSYCLSAEEAKRGRRLRSVPTLGEMHGIPRNPRRPT